jgi:hypothetical protein
LDTNTTTMRKVWGLKLLALNPNPIKTLPSS